jgi:hypothetical protein
VASDHRIEGASEIAFAALFSESQVGAYGRLVNGSEVEAMEMQKEWGSELLPDFAGGNPA